MSNKITDKAWKMFLKDMEELAGNRWDNKNLFDKILGIPSQKELTEKYKDGFEAGSILTINVILKKFKNKKNKKMFFKHIKL